MIMGQAHQWPLSICEPFFRCGLFIYWVDLGW